MKQKSPEEVTTGKVHCQSAHMRRLAKP